MWVDYNPETGIKDTSIYEEETGILRIRRQEDVSALIERNKILANNGIVDNGIKRGLWHYATIPVTVQMELRQKGLDVFSKDTSVMKRIRREINQNYPYLKLTHKHHE